MAYDEELSDRIRELVASEPDLTEKKMFGGLGISSAATWRSQQAGRAEILVRVNPA